MSKAVEFFNALLSADFWSEDQKEFLNKGMNRSLDDVLIDTLVEIYGNVFYYKKDSLKELAKGFKSGEKK